VMRYASQQISLINWQCVHQVLLRSILFIILPKCLISISSPSSAFGLDHSDSTVVARIAVLSPGEWAKLPAQVWLLFQCI
jgi:hypothetical protein